MAVFPADSVRTKTWSTELLTSADLHAQLDLLHAYLQAALDSASGHDHDGTSNQGQKISPANLVIASQAAADLLVASSATAWKRLAKGTAGQVLKMNSGATDVEWGAGATAASKSDQEASTESAKYVAPATQHFHPSAAKAWVTFDGTGSGTLTPTASYGVTSVVKNGTGDYTITWAAEFSSSNYVVLGSACDSSAGANTPGFIGLRQAADRLTTSSRILTWKYNSTVTDYPSVSICAFGDI